MHDGCSCLWAKLSRLSAIVTCAGLLLGGSRVARAGPVLLGLVVGDPASDDFERASLGNQWTTYKGNPHIVGSSDFGADPGLNIATWTANTFSADQFSECELSDPLDTTQIEIFVRRGSGAQTQRYGFAWVDNTYPECGSAWSSTVGGVVLKLDGGAARTLTCVERPVVVAGDVLRIEARGEFLTGFVNGELVIQTTDQTLTQPGEPGIAMAPFAGTGNDRVGCERWRGGSLPATGAIVLETFEALALQRDDSGVFDPMTMQTIFSVTDDSSGVVATAPGIGATSRSFATFFSTPGT